MLKVSARNHLEKLIKHRALTHREKQILLALNDVGLMTRHQLESLFFPSAGMARRKLKLMYDNHLLDAGGDEWFQYIKPNIDQTDRTILVKGAPTIDFGLRKSFLYSPALVGRLVISFEHRQRIEDINFDSRRYDALYSTHLTLHDLWISEAYVQLRLMSQKHNLLFDWKNEANSVVYSRHDSQDEIVRPDATFTSWFQPDPMSSPKSFARFIEMDRGSTKWEAKVEQYNRAFAEGNWQNRFDRFPTVLCVLPNRLFDKGVDQIRTHLGPVRFYGKTWGDFIEDPCSDWLDINSGDPAALLPADYLA
ncbi:MAG: replication-relaxation family protein [Chloroflexota bacterium]